MKSKSRFNNTGRKDKPWGPEETQPAECSSLCWCQSSEQKGLQRTGGPESQVHRRPQRVTMRLPNPTGQHSESAQIQGINRNLYHWVEETDCWGKAWNECTNTAVLGVVVLYVSTSRYFFTQSRKTTLDLSSSSCSFSLDSISLFSLPLTYST